MTPSHKAKLATAHRGKTHSSETKRKISNSLSGEKSNFAGKKHSKDSKDIIADKRGHSDRIQGRKWIVNKFTNKTWRKYSTPSQKFKYGRTVKEFKEWLEDN